MKIFRLANVALRHFLKVPAADTPTLSSVRTRETSFRNLIYCVTEMALLLLVFVPMPSSSGGFETIKQTTLVNDSGSSRYCITKAKKGGYLIAGDRNILAGPIDLYKVDSNGQVLWHQLIVGTKLAWQFAKTVFEDEDGSILVGGTSNSLDLVGEHWEKYTSNRANVYKNAPSAALLAKFDSRGKLLWKKAYGRIERRKRSEFYRGIKVSDGYMLIGYMTGTKHPAGPPAREIPFAAIWIVKVTKSGEVQWERTLEVDQGSTIYTTLDEHDLSPIQIDSVGNIVFAAAVGIDLSDSRHELETTVDPVKNGRVLIFKFDKNGNELARQRLPRKSHPSLIKNGNEYVLLRNLRGEGGDGIHSVRFGEDLSIVSDRTISARTFFLRAAIPGIDGGSYLLGQYLPPSTERGFAMIAYLPKEGGIRDETTLTSRLLLFSSLTSWKFLSSSIDVARGESSDEIAALWHPTQNRELRLSILKLKH